MIDYCDLLSSNEMNFIGIKLSWFNMKFHDNSFEESYISIAFWEFIDVSSIPKIQILQFEHFRMKNLRILDHLIANNFDCCSLQKCVYSTRNSTNFTGN